MEYDVRLKEELVIEEIVFSDPSDKDGDDVAYYLTSLSDMGIDNGCRIEDDEDALIIQDKQHALNLIKALEKAIDLGWLK